MIFERIVLHNFGLYRGRHEIDLAPPSRERPVVLIGGLNGAGKTTLLDSLQLALYGKRAKLSNRNGASYSDHLRRCISQGVAAADGAAVELTFRTNIDGQDESYGIHRSWRATGKGLRERVEVLRNGQLDRVLTDRWDEVVEQFLPIGLSDLLLFDGEKIEALADLESSSELLRSALHRLLGLDVVDQLSTDLVAVERNQRLKWGSAKDRDEVALLEAQVRELIGRADACRQDVAGLRNQLDAEQGRLRAVDLRFEREGGELFERRRGLEEERARLAGEVGTAEEDLRSLAAAEAPLLLVVGLLGRVGRQAVCEEEGQRGELMAEILTTRDRKVIDYLGDIDAPADVQEQLEGFLAGERRQHEASETVDRFLGLTREDGSRVNQLLTGLGDELRAELVSASERADEARERLAEAERRLSAVPDDDAIAALQTERDACRQAHAATEAQIVSREAELSALQAERERVQEKLGRRLELVVRSDMRVSDSDRVVEYSGRARALLVRFREEVLAKHSDRIRHLVLESFGRLLRKDDLVTDLAIDVDPVGIRLFGRDGKELPASRLSAGERQLFAVSLLWGLAQASGRSLPAVIDTPLGRLDSEHREHLVTRYFPVAGQQVLLLSTDEEIDEGHYERLKPSIGRAYRLEYDRDQGQTRVLDGYFWE